MIPAALALAITVVWAMGEGGFPSSEWYPGGLILLGLLAVTASALPISWSEIPGTVKVAVASLAAFAVWSFLSIVWADAKGVAWEGANRTLIYVIVFALFALWPIRATAAAGLLTAWVGSLAVVTAATLVHVTTATDPLEFFTSTRLHEPAGYANATAALLLMPSWLGLVLVARRELPWWLRGSIAAAVIVLASAALMAQSRGATYALPIVLVSMFAVGTDRRRLFAACVPVGLGLAVSWSRVLATDARLAEGDPTDALANLTLVVALTAIAVGLAVAAGAFFDQRNSGRTAPGRRARQLMTYLAAATAAIALIGTIVAVGNPAERVTDAWHSFKQGYSESDSDSRLTSGLGSNRYDFYRVALDLFRENPILGVGVDNFQQSYMRHRASPETPRYPHSFELRALSQTGLVGTTLLLLAIVAALFGAFRTMRQGGFDGAIATAAATAFLYWLVHGSFDWFFEFAGLGVPGFALLGLAASVSHRASATSDERRSRPPIFWLSALALLGAAALSLLLPWRADVETNRAASQWRSDPQHAFARIDRAARLNPLSDRPYAVGGTIALRAGDRIRAQRFFRSAVERNPNDAYSAFELGAILSADPQRRAEAVALLERAHRLNPRDPIFKAALKQARTRRAVTLERFNTRLQERSERLAP